MRGRKGYFDISKQRKKGNVKMALDDPWKQKKEQDRSRGEKTDDSDEYNLAAKYDRSMQFWSSFSRIKATEATTNDGDKCGLSLPLLEDTKAKDNDVQDKKHLSNSENKEKMLKCSNKENKKVHVDTTSDMDLKLSNSQISMQKTKFKQKMNKRRKLLLNKYEIERRNRESINKESCVSNNASEITLVSNKTDKIQIPVQINKEKLQISSEVRLFEKEANKSKSSYYKSETMEADSTVSNDKKDDIHIYSNKNKSKLKDVSQRELCRSVTANKFLDNFNVPTVFNRNDLNKKERKRKRIKQKFRYLFDECLTISEEEEEESILDFCIYKRQKNDSNEKSKYSTNVESYASLDMTLSQTETQDINTNLVVCEDITNNIVSTETFKIKKIKRVEAVSNTTSAVECNNVEIEMQNESPTVKNVHEEKTEKSTFIGNDKVEQIQPSLPNELQYKIVNYSSESNSLNSENNVEGDYVKEPCTLQKSIDTERNVLPDFNINNDNCNDTNIKILTNCAIKTRTSNEESSSNNNFDEITCRVSQNSCIKESDLIADSDDSGTATKILNSTLDSASSVEEILEISTNIENQSENLQDPVSVDATEKRENLMIANITESHIKNINDSSMDKQIKVTPCTETSKCTLRNSDISQQNIIESPPKVDKQCTKNVSEDLSQLLQIDVNQNHRIQSNGNTISIQENFEKDSNQHVMVKDILISNVTDTVNETSSKHSTSQNEERLLEKHSTMVTDIDLTENINTCNKQNKDGAVLPILSDEQPKPITNNNTVDNISPIVSDTSKQHTLLDCNSQNTDNLKKSETIQPNKIRVLSSAELGSRWCPTPVNNPTSYSENEPKLPNHTIMENLNDNQPCKDSSKSTKLNLNSIPDSVQLTLSYIYNIMMRIRSIEKKYLSNNCPNINTGNQNKLRDDEQFKSNFKVLLQEFVNLATELKMSNIATELKIFDMDKVVQYAIHMINKYYMQSQCELITIHELSRYMKLLNTKASKSAAAIPSSDVSVLDGQSTNLDSVYTAPTKSIPTVSNNPNVVSDVTAPFIPNVYVPIVPQGHIASNNLPKQNTYLSNVLNQNHEHISNVQAMQTSNASISYISSVQQTYKNMQLLPESRTSSINKPYYQHLIQQQSIPVVAVTNAPNANIMQLKNNVHVAQRINMHQKPQEGLIGNKPELLIGQSSTPQRLPQQIISHNIPQVSQKSAGAQIYMAQNSKSTKVPLSTTSSMHSSNLLSGTNAISHELVFKIWDQLTYCLEKRIVDYILHNKTYCFLQSFYEKWKKPMNNFMYQKMRSPRSELLFFRSQNAKLMYYTLTQEKWEEEQLLLKNKKLQNQSLLMNMLNISKRKNVESPLNVKSRNETVQSEVTQHRSRKSKKKAEYEKQHQSQDQSNLQLVNNFVVSVSNEVSNASENNNSVLVESNFINSDNTMVLSHKNNNVENVNVTTSTSLERKTEKQQNDIKTLQNVYTQEERLLSKQIITGEIVDVEEESSSSEQTIREVVHIQEECSLPKEIITEEIVQEQEKSSLPEQAITEVVHVQEECSLPKEIITEEIVHAQEKSSLLEQAITEVVHVQEECSLSKDIITEEILHAQEKCSSPEQAIREVVHMEEESSLPEETVTEVLYIEKESSLPEQIIEDNNNYLQCDSMQSLTLLDPHIVDVRSISLNSFNKMENMFALNDLQLPFNEDTESNEITVKIEIPEEKICLQCSKPSIVACEVCINALYCSKECAELHWTLEHHKYCKPFDLKSSEKNDNDALTTEDTDFDVNHTKMP